MSLTEMLRRDHQLLRRKLEFLESAMQLAPETQFVLREMCWSLAHMLTEHIRHENEVLRPYSNRIKAFTHWWMAQDHADQQIVLRDINALLLGGMKAPISRVVPPLTHLIEELREHMEEEEREVFPMVYCLASQHPQAPPPLTALSPVITEAMTVNHVLKTHPRAREIFQAFQIDCDADGLHCLDELYWRRGIDVQTLLHVLNKSERTSAAVQPCASNLVEP